MANNNIEINPGIAPRTIDAEKMRNDYAYEIARRIITDAYNRGLLNKCQFEKAMEINLCNFRPFLYDLI